MSELKSSCDMVSQINDSINSKDYSFVAQKFRSYCLSKGMIEVHPQARLSILAACEDPSTISQYEYVGETWPLAQTNQMWLEYEMLKDSSPYGYFCVSTSYRNEPNPIPGRHNLIFPMFEFEIKGDMEELMRFERGLLEYFGYGKAESFPENNYIDVAKQYKTFDIDHEHEQQLYAEHGPVFFLKNFPNYTSPFWNMKKWEQGGGAYKIDVILSGQETIGSAERSCNKDQMRHDFKTISNGLYAKTIYNKFSKERVDAEMDQFLSHDFLVRSGGGIGVNRLIRSMNMEGLIKHDQ